MTSAVRTGLLAVFASLAVACGGGGGYSPPPPPPPPPPPSGPAAPPTFTSPATVTVRENMIGVVYRPLATDPNGDAITYGAIGGPDAARFTANPLTREVRFAAQPDFEAPGDAGANNVYNISFTASDGTNTVTHNVAITVTNVNPGFRVRRVASGMSAPIYATGLPDGSGRIVIVERAGRIRVLNPTTGAFEATDFLNISSQIDTTGEKGLLSIAFPPDAYATRTFYLHLNPINPNGSSPTEIRRYETLETSYAQADTTTANAILTIPQPAASNHKGGTLAFDNAGRMLISLGDGGSDSGTAQNNNTLLGKILRVDPWTDAFPSDPARDYAIPAANPFATTGGLPEIFISGMRNPFRMSVDPVTGDLFIGDVGQSAREEIDRVAANATGLVNMGWNICEGTLPSVATCSGSGFTLPVTDYPRSGAPNVGTTVTGGVVYRGPIEDLQGQYIFGDFGSNALWSVPIANLVNGTVFPSASYTVRTGQFVPDAGAINSVVAFGTDNDGNVYIVDIGGEVFILEPNS